MTTTIISSLDIKNLQDVAPPIGAYLSGSYIRSFAYKTIKDRLPVIVTGIIDTMSRNKDFIVKKYGSNSSDELKEVIGKLSQLRSEIMTDKPLALLNLINNEKDRDAAVWNECIENRKDKLGIPPTWYNTVWLFSECYMYRRISHILATTQTLSNYDPFEDRKNDSFIKFHHVVGLLAKYVMNLINNTDNYTSEKYQEDLINLLKLNLWGNRCDLSLNNGSAINADETDNPIEQLKQLDNYLLIDDSISVWNLLKQSKETQKNIIVDIVLDNAGYEFFTDLCLATFLTAHNFAQKIRFYVKEIPWFVSDTMKKDIIWLIDNMKNSSNIQVKALGEKCWNYINNGQWTIEVESYWTEPFDFSEMKNQSPKLYAKLAEAKLIIFKGDLNYRKLLGDINWKYETNFTTALREFKPTNIVSLRTIKADLIVNLPEGKATELYEKEENWMTTGQYGLINAAIN